MNIIKKKCMLITPCNVTFRTSSGKEIKPNTKSIEFVLTKEILVAMNSGIRVFEIGSDGKQVQLNKSNFDKINVLMNYDETAEEKEALTEAPVAPVKITAPAWLKGETDHPSEDEPKDEETVDPAEEESPSEEGDEPEDEEVDMTPQEDPEAKYYDNDSDSKDDCDEEKENGEDDEFNVD